jgi:hypothetical protein
MHWKMRNDMSQPFIDIIKECERIWGVKLSHLKVVVEKSRLWGCGKTIVGECTPSKSLIRIMPLSHYTQQNILLILTHELAHYVDWYRSGGEWRKVRGRKRFHDSVFRAILAEVAASHPEWVQDLKRRGVANQ